MYHFDIGIDFEFKPKALNPRARRLIANVPFGFDRQSQPERLVGSAADDEITQLAEQAAEVDRTAIHFVRYVAEIIGRAEHADLELKELVRRMLELELRLRGREASEPLAEPALRLSGNLTLAFQADGVTFGEAEDVFGFDVAVDDGAELGLYGDDALAFGRELEATTDAWTDDDVCDQYSELLLCGGCYKRPCGCDS